MIIDVSPGLQVSVVGLERALNAYVKESPDTPFDIKTVPLATASMQEQMAKPKKQCTYYFV